MTENLEAAEESNIMNCVRFLILFATEEGLLVGISDGIRWTFYSGRQSRDR